MMNSFSPYPLNIDANIEKDIRLADIVQILKDGKRWIFSMTGICALLGAVYAFTIPPEYEASANIEMASAAGTAVEAPGILAEKLRLPLYYSRNTYQACQAENKQPSPGEFLTTRLKPMVNKNAPIVSIRFRAGSAIQARQCLESVLSDVKRNQESLLKPILDTKTSQLKLLQKKLEGAEKMAALLPARRTKIDFNDPQFSAFALLLATSVAKDSEIRNLRIQINDLQISLAEPQTRGTTLVTPIYAPDVKVAPQRALTILSSAIAGFLLGILFVATKRIFFTGALSRH